MEYYLQLLSNCSCILHQCMRVPYYDSRVGNGLLTVRTVPVNFNIRVRSRLEV